ncbi:heme-dependent oxidative N-demethylase family protein [Roseibium litorale]|nr:DUF3445 domain-containing protein [Roseibium litorale]
MAFLHTPYDGSKQPFSVGLEPAGEAEWLETDEAFLPQLARKQDLLASARETVFQAKEDTVDAQREVLDLVVSNLRSRPDAYPDWSGGLPVLRHENGEAVFAGGPGEPELLTASRFIQEDLVLMRKSDAGYYLAAACLCFPSSWSLADKFGQSMHGIHEHVPDFNTGRMGQVVARIFQNLQTSQLLARYNWSIYDTLELHHPKPKSLSPQILDGSLASLGALFIRVERQTLRRLPGSGDILFTIKIHHDPISQLQRDPRGCALVGSLREQLLGLSADQLAYKGLMPFRDALASALSRMAAAESEALA